MMIVAVDTQCGLAPEREKTQQYTRALIDTLRRPGSPASHLLILTSKANHASFRSLADDRTDVIKLPRLRHKGKKFASAAELLERHPIGGRRTLAEFQRAKAELLASHGAELVHFPAGIVDPLDVNLPAVVSVDDLRHRYFPQYFSRGEIDLREKWGVASAFRANAMLVPSGYVRDDLQRQLGLERGKIFRAPPPLDPAFGESRSAESLGEVRRRMELPETFFLLPAAALPHKNHARLIRAFAAADIAGAQLILTGDQQAGSPLPRLIAELGAEFAVRLMGRIAVADLAALYWMATALVLPSEHEPWSSAVAEAFACGCPVASSNATGLAEQVGDGGILFDPRDELAMEEAMCRLAGDAELRRDLADRGRRRTAAAGPSAFLSTLSMAYAAATATCIKRKAA